MIATTTPARFSLTKRFVVAGGRWRALRTKSVWLSTSTLSSENDYYGGETSSSPFPPGVDDLVQHYSKLPQTSASLQMLMKTGRGELLGKSYKPEAISSSSSSSSFGKYHCSDHTATERILIHVSNFLRKEVPIRLAHRIQDLDQVPMMRDMPAVQAVKGIYIDSFRQMMDYPPIYTPEEEEAFAFMLEALYNKHANVLVKMAKGAYQLREAIRKGGTSGTHHHPAVDGGSIDNNNHDLEFERMDECHAFLDRFYMSRIGIRVLAGQYLALRQKPVPDHIGMICLKTSPHEIVRQAAEDAKRMCRRQYRRAPLVEITGRLDLVFPYMPTYLHYILLELLKNALRATVETHGEGRRLPPVTVIIADGMDNEDVVIKIMDEGGGIRRSQMEKVWSYLFTTADSSIQEGFIGDTNEDHSNDSPIAGLGYGLPISRSYCRYFGGAMDIVSMEGYGTDAFVHLKRLGDSEEPLPVA